MWGATGLVSNRVPLPSERGPRAGGLAVALADALRPGTLWFGWSGRRSGAADRKRAMQRAEGATYATIDLSEADYRSFYVDFANGALWPLLHFRLGLVDFRREDCEGYRAVNRRFAEALAPLLRDGRPDLGARLPSVPAGRGAAQRSACQPYRLLPAHAVRAAGAVHALPRATELLRAMCAFDVVGFHTRIYQRPSSNASSEIAWHEPIADGAFNCDGRLFARSSIRSASTLRSSRRPPRTRRTQRRNGTAARQPGRPRAGHRRRPARLLQGPRQPLRGIWPLLANIPSIAARSASCRSPRGPARSPAATSVCGASWIALSATPTAASPSSTGCRCAI